MKEEEGDESEAYDEDYENYDSNYRTDEQEYETNEPVEDQRVKSKRWDQLYELVSLPTLFTQPGLKSPLASKLLSLSLKIALDLTS